MEYKEKLEEAKKLYKSANGDQKRVLESLFPELKESENVLVEKIRQDIISYLNHRPIASMTESNATERWLAWLEKQGGANVFDAPKISIKDAVEVSSRMQHIEDDMKPIADFIIDYALWDLRKDEWNQPTITVPLFRVLDALIQKGKPYCECAQKLDKQDNDKPIKVMKSPEESLGISSKEYNDIVNECLYGEKKPTGKVEPKFHEGEWVLNDVCLPVQIASIKDDLYVFTEGDAMSVSFVDNNFHLWTLQDARDGDVLAEDTCIFIIKKLDSDLGAKIYCCLHDDGDFEINAKLVFDDASTYPANKEQRDALFSKMKEAGYVFDFDKKELRKITSPADVGFEELGKAWAKENKKKSADWGKGDAVRLQRIIDFLWYNRKGDTDTIYQQEQDIDWLKSLGQRMGG